jgi:hypothetical protein
VGQDQRAPEGVGPVEYRLEESAATRRAVTAAALGAATSTAPLLLAVVLMKRLGWGPSFAFWVVAAGLALLVAVRHAVFYGALRRRLRALVVVVSDDGIRQTTTRDASSVGRMPEGTGRYVTIARAGVARIVEVEGALGGLRVEAWPDAAGSVFVVNVPRGGAGLSFAEVRSRLERWRPIERRGRRGPAARLALGAAIVIALFFTPFLLEDLVARSKLVAAALVVGAWVVMRAAAHAR